MDVVRKDIKKRKTKKKLIVLLSIAGVMLFGWLMLSLIAPAAPRVPLDTLWAGNVKRGEMVREIRGAGTLVPKESRWLATSVEGRVENIRVKPGAKVKVNEVIVELNNPELHQIADEASWAIEASEAQMNVLEVQLESQYLTIESELITIEADYESSILQVEAEEILAKKNITSKIDLQRSILKSAQLKKRMEIMKYRLKRFKDSSATQLKAHSASTEQLRKIHHRRQQQVESLLIRSTIDGIVQDVRVEEGQRVSLGVNVAKLARPDDLIAELLIPETQAKYIQLGLTVNVDTRNGIAKGVIDRIDPRVKNGTVQVDVIFTENLPVGARPDLNVDGTITLERLENILYVNRPSQAESESQMSIFLINGEETEANRTPVYFGRSSVNQIEVIQGLNEGDRIILSDMTNWSDKDRIRLE